MITPSAPIHKVQIAAGHADPHRTERYWHAPQNLEDNAADFKRTFERDR